MMEWKLIALESPTPDSYCVTVDTQGQYSLRIYKEVFIYDSGKQGKRMWTLEKSSWKGDPLSKEYRYIRPTSHHGPVSSKNTLIFFYELPTPPDDVKKANAIKEQIKQLEKELELLGSEKRV